MYFHHRLYVKDGCSNNEVTLWVMGYHFEVSNLESALCHPMDPIENPKKQCMVHPTLKIFYLIVSYSQNTTIIY